MRVTSSLVLGLALTACSGSSKPGTNTNTTGGGNVAPTIASVALTPDPGYEDTLMNCTPQGVTDANGDPVTSKYAWIVDGVDIGADPASSTLDGTSFDKGATVQCIVTPNDGATDGVPVSSNEVEILNSPPRANGVDVDPSPATPRDTLVATATGWSDPDPADGEAWRYEWFVNGSPAGGGTDQLSGAFSKGDQVYVVATPDDGTDLGDPVQSAVVNILNTPPELGTVQLTPTSPGAADVLTCSPQNPSDQDGDTVTFVYQWFVNGTAAGSGTDILASPAFASGDTVYCIVTPNDGEDDGTPVQSNQVTIGNSPPVIASVTLSPDPATELNTLSCTPNGLTDPDNDPVTVTFSWTVGGLPIAATGSTINGADFDKGDAVQCTVNASDGTAASPPAMSNVVVIQNTPPSVTSGSVSPNPIYTSNDASVAAFGWNDVDGDAEGYNYQWYLNGIAIPGATSRTLLSPLFVKHDLLSCEITPNDGDDVGTPITTPMLEVQNTPPTQPQAQIQPATPDVSDSLLCAFAILSTDADQDSVSYSFEWRRNGVVTAYTTNSVPASATVLGDNWQCTITPFDGEDNGTAATSSVVVMDGTAPDPPVITGLDEYRNETVVNIEGTGERGAVIDISVTCDMGSSTTLQTAVDPLGNWDYSGFTMLPGETCDFEATATDAGMNTSGPSVVESTTVCANADDWELVTPTYGDSSTNPVDEWGPLADNGTGTIYLEGNILDQDPADWFVISTTDNLSADRIAGANNYDLTASLTVGDLDYTFVVYKGAVGGQHECPTEINGYTDYNDYQADQNDAPNHGAVSPTNACRQNSSSYNDCTDMSNDYFIRVLRHTPGDCTPYQITITNNAP